jgi:predicted cupin superfamily sugar epimerase
VAPTADALIAALDLRPHPEGGFYREIYRSPLSLDGLPHGAPRPALTGIYFLLPAGTFSAWHRVRSDEVWHHYQGDPVRLHVIVGGVHHSHRLGQDILAGERPQVVVPADAWQAAEPIGDRYALCGCNVAPGFDFADFEMPEADDLVRLLPDHAALARRLGRQAPCRSPRP